MNYKVIVWLLLIFGLIFSGCSGMMAPAGPPIEGSVINQHISDLKQADFFLTIQQHD